jgi:hypothetical protein
MDHRDIDALMSGIVPAVHEIVSKAFGGIVERLERLEKQTPVRVRRAIQVNLARRERTASTARTALPVLMARMVRRVVTASVAKMAPLASTAKTDRPAVMALMAFRVSTALLG